jgi:hypothetical protein
MGAKPSLGREARRPSKGPHQRRPSRQLVRANVPHWGGSSAAGSLLASHRPQYTWACVLRVVQAITRVALSLCLVPRLVNVAARY